jgi:hypothetical protein
VTETSARAAAVVRGQLLQPGRLGVFLHHMPHHLICNPAAPYAPVASRRSGINGPP